jgi:hypothetical protein
VEIADEQDNMSQQPFNYEGDLTNLSEGNHSLQIHVWSMSSYNSFYNESDWHTWDMIEFYRMDTYSQKINFTIATSTEPIQTQTPNSTPTSTSTSPTPNIIIERFPNYPLLMQIAIILATAILAVVVSVFALRKYRKSTKVKTLQYNWILKSFSKVKTNRKTDCYA